LNERGIIEEGGFFKRKKKRFFSPWLVSTGIGRFPGWMLARKKNSKVKFFDEKLNQSVFEPNFVPTF
jgi:hypothetical protein